MISIKEDDKVFCFSNVVKFCSKYFFFVFTAWLLLVSMPFSYNQSLYRQQSGCLCKSVLTLSSKNITSKLRNNRFIDDIGYVPYVVTTIPFPFHEGDLPNWTIYRIYNHIRNSTGATCGAWSAYLSRAPESTPSFWWGSRCLVFRFLCCGFCAIICLFVFLFVAMHGVVSLYSINEFDCPSGIFRPSFVRELYVFSVCSLKKLASNTLFFFCSPKVSVVKEERLNV